MTGHKIEIEFVPVCPSCGREMNTSGNMTSPDFKPRSIFDRERSWRNTKQYIFVHPCKKCFAYVGGEKSELPNEP